MISHQQPLMFRRNGRLSLPYVVALALSTVVVAASAISIIQCSTTTNTDGDDSVIFSVGRTYPSRQLEGVDVIVVRKDVRLETLGQTDSAGHFSVSKRLLSEENSVVVLFCQERYFCGAFRLSELDLPAAKLRLIHLAPLAVP